VESTPPVSAFCRIISRGWSLRGAWWSEQDVSHEKRIAALERENADLKACVEALQLLLSPNKPAPSRREEQQVKITTSLPRVVLPS
jgi:hypothetical protein